MLGVPSQSEGVEGTEDVVMAKNISVKSGTASDAEGDRSPGIGATMMNRTNLNNTRNVNENIPSEQSNPCKEWQTNGDSDCFLLYVPYNFNTFYTIYLKYLFISFSFDLQLLLSLTMNGNFFFFLQGPTATPPRPGNASSVEGGLDLPSLKVWLNSFSICQSFFMLKFIWSLFV